MKTENIIAIIGIIVAVVAIIASYFIGARSGMINDKRKEWNALAEPLLIIFEEQRSAYSRGLLSKHDRKDARFPYDSVNAIKRRISGKDLDAFNAKYSEYHRLKVAMNDADEKPFTEMGRVIDEMIPLLTLK